MGCHLFLSGFMYVRAMDRGGRIFVRLVQWSLLPPPAACSMKSADS